MSLPVDLFGTTKNIIATANESQRNIIVLHLPNVRKMMKMGKRVLATSLNLVLSRAISDNKIWNLVNAFVLLLTFSLIFVQSTNLEVYRWKVDIESFPTRYAAS